MNEDLNTTDHADLAAGLVKRIERLNQVINQRKGDANADSLAIEEFTARREKYVHELNKLLWSIGLTGEMHTSQIAA